MICKWTRVFASIVKWLSVRDFKDFLKKLDIDTSDRQFDWAKLEKLASSSEECNCAPRRSRSTSTDQRSTIGSFRNSGSVDVVSCIFAGGPANDLVQMGP